MRAVVVFLCIAFASVAYGAVMGIDFGSEFVKVSTATHGTSAVAHCHRWHFLLLGCAREARHALPHCS